MGLLLCVGALLWLWPATPLQAIGKASKFQVAMLKLDDEQASVRPGSMRRLMLEVKRRTSLQPEMLPVKLQVRDPRLFSFPLVVLQGRRAFARWPKEDIVRLRAFLVAGGTLFIDVSDGVLDAGFDRSARRLVKRLFPNAPMQRLQSKHTLFRSFYLLRRFGGRVLRRPYIEGVVRDDRSPVIYSTNDHSGAWSRDNYGNWTFAVVPGGSSQREHAFRFGINLVMYALCVNYKQDGVHIPFIMRRRK